jgi:hypothetical protein
MSDLITMMSAAAGQVGGEYQISRSLRFNSADSAYLSRTPASAGNRKTWTWSGWVKRGKSGDFMTLFSAAADTSNLTIMRFKDDNKIEVRNAISAATQFQLVTTQVFRDFSSFYHIVLAVDTDNGTAGDRVRLYVNGVEVTAFDTDTQPSSGNLTFVNNTQAHNIGRDSGNPSNYYFDGYLTDINFIDGQALTPSSFGETNETTGVWSPIRYAGSYGTNGFYLKFSNNSDVTAATLGADYSGNGNNWTPSGSPGFSVTAGAGNDSLVDTPTQYGTDTGAGGQVRGNYATFNPLNTQIAHVAFLENGNLTLNATSGVTPGTYVNSKSTLSASTFSNYCEMTVTARSNSNGLIGIGVGNSVANIANGVGAYIVYREGGTIFQNPGGTTLDTVASYTQGDVIGMTIDATNVKFYKNNLLQGTYAHGFTGDYFVVGMAYNNGGTAVLDFNFGQRPFAYTAPSGFKALVTTNLPEPTVVQGDDYFNTVLYTGNGSSLSVTGVGFQPDFVWIKSRSSAALYHALFDGIRGINKRLFTNTTDAEDSTADTLVSFDTNGFTLGAQAGQNSTGSTYVGWNWKANGAGSLNELGTISSTVSANTIAGISIVTYTGTGATGGTVGHGLATAPRFIIVKNRDRDYVWVCFHASLGANAYILLNTTNGSTSESGYWGSGVTSTTFGLQPNNLSGINYLNEKHVAYCFAEVEGFSKFGSYTGNGSADGPFVYTGFRPAFLMVKRSSSGAATNWIILDTSRDIYNLAGQALLPNLPDAEYTPASSGYPMDILSNGFKQRGTSVSQNASSETYIYMAFAENPFKYSLAR